MPSFSVNESPVYFCPILSVFSYEGATYICRAKRVHILYDVYVIMSVLPFIFSSGFLRFSFAFPSVRYHFVISGVLSEYPRSLA